MLALLSPAKRLDFESSWDHKKYTQPVLLDEAEELVQVIKKLSQSRLQNLMKLSDNLAALNHARYKHFTTPFTKDNARPAITALKGDAYVGLEAQSLTTSDLTYAQKHIGILSGLYGVLRPLDLMQAYRLEMGTKLSNPRGHTLYSFWGDRLTQRCNKIVQKHKDQTIISLASNEYIKAINPKKLTGPFLTCHFKEVKNGTPKTIGLFAKRARGMMARHIIQNRIETPTELKKFKTDGYAFAPKLSDDHNYVFLRKRG